MKTTENSPVAIICSAGMGLHPLPGINIAVTLVGFRLGPVTEQVSFPLHPPGWGGSKQTIAERMRGPTGRDGVIPFPLLGGWNLKL